MEFCEGRVREIARHQQEALCAHIELEAYISHLAGELSHSQEASRKANYDFIKCLDL
jgi:hypothetical protein